MRRAKSCEGEVDTVGGTLTKKSMGVRPRRSSLLIAKAHLDLTKVAPMAGRTAGREQVICSTFESISGMFGVSFERFEILNAAV